MSPRLCRAHSLPLFSAVLFITNSPHLAACRISRRRVTHGLCVFSSGTCDPTHYSTRPAVSGSHSWFSTWIVHEWTQVCIPYFFDSTSLASEDLSTSASPWLHITLTAWLKPSSFTVSWKSHSGSQEPSSRRSSNHRSWLSKYAHSWSSWADSLFCCLMWSKDSCHVEYSCRSTYEFSSGLVCCSFSHDVLYRRK